MPTKDEVKEYMKVFFMNNDQIPPKNFISLRFGATEREITNIILELERDGFIKKNACNKYMFCRG